MKFVSKKLKFFLLSSPSRGNENEIRNAKKTLRRWTFNEKSPEMSFGSVFHHARRNWSEKVSVSLEEQKANNRE